MHFWKRDRRIAMSGALALGMLLGVFGATEGKTRGMCCLQWAPPPPSLNGILASYRLYKRPVGKKYPPKGQPTLEVAVVDIPDLDHPTVKVPCRVGDRWRATWVSIENGESAYGNELRMRKKDIL